MPVAFKIYWGLHNTAMVTAFVITIIYWTVLHKRNETRTIQKPEKCILKFSNHFPTAGMPLNSSNILSHAMNSVIMFLDLLIVAYPLRLLHVIQPIIFGVTFGFFSFIYYLCGGKNMYVIPFFQIHVNSTNIRIFLFVFLFCSSRRSGQPYIYPVLDWSKPGKALVTTFGTLFLALAVHMFLFSVYKLRVFIQRRCCSTDMILPTTASKMQSTNSLQSRISMVFASETNEAYKSSSSDRVNT